MENSLSPWRDLSLAWLTLLTGLALIAPALLFYFAQLYLRRFNRWLRLTLLHIHVWALRIEQGTTRTCDRIAYIPIGLYCINTRFRTTISGVANFLRSK
jgi:hypothetical protein